MMKQCQEKGSTKAMLQLTVTSSQAAIKNFNKGIDNYVSFVV